MGHYDSCYEYDEEQARKQRAKECKAARKKIDSLRDSLPQDTPQRFLDSLEDLDNYLAHLEAARD